MAGRSTVKRIGKLLETVTAARLVLQTLAPLAPIGQASPAYAAPAETAQQQRALINVKMKPSANGADVDQTVRGAGGETERDLAQIRTRIVKVPADKQAQVLAALSRQPSVERADAAILLAKAGTPNDPAYAQQWALPKIGWDQAYGTVAVNGSAKIAVLDTGVDATHPDLAGRLAAGQTFIPDGNPHNDPNGHGTALAGIVAANVNNAAGIAGVAYAGANVSSVQVLGGDGTGWDSDVVAGVLWAADNGAQVILMGLWASAARATRPHWPMP